MIHIIIVGGLYTIMVIKFITDAKGYWDNYIDSNIDCQKYFMAYHS